MAQLDGHARWVGPGGGYPTLLRRVGPQPSTEDPTIRLLPKERLVAVLIE